MGTRLVVVGCCAGVRKEKQPFIPEEEGEKNRPFEKSGFWCKKRPNHAENPFTALFPVLWAEISHTLRQFRLKMT